MDLMSEGRRGEKGDPKEQLRPQVRKALEASIAKNRKALDELAKR